MKWNCFRAFFFRLKHKPLFMEAFCTRYFTYVYYLFDVKGSFVLLSNTINHRFWFDKTVYKRYDFSSEFDAFNVLNSCFAQLRLRYGVK